MKTCHLLPRLLVTLFALGFGFTSAAQVQTGDNPNYDRDIELVTSYIDALIAGDLDLAKTKLHTDFMSYGPTVSDSANAALEMQNWTQTHENYSNLETTYVAHSWRVLEGNYQGDWVAVWGMYGATHKALSKTISLPYHVISRIEEAKIRTIRSYWDNVGPVTQLGGTVSVPGADGGN